MTRLVIAHVMLGLAITAAGVRLGRLAFVLGALPMLGSVTYAGTQAPDVLDGRPTTESVT